MCASCIKNSVENSEPELKNPGGRWSCVYPKYSTGLFSGGECNNGSAMLSPKCVRGTSNSSVRYSRRSLALSVWKTKQANMSMMLRRLDWHSLSAGKLDARMTNAESMFSSSITQYCRLRYLLRKRRLLCWANRRESSMLCPTQRQNC